MSIKRFLIIFFLLFSINNMLNAEINFEVNYSLPINSEYGNVSNVQLVNIDNNDVDEILVDQINANSGHTTIFSQSGQILNEFIHLINNNEKFEQSVAYHENDNNYLICTSSYKSQSEDTLYFQLKTYDLLENTLIDSSRIFLFEEGDLNKVYNINVLNYMGNKILYIGIEYHYFDENYITKSYLLRYSFNEGISNFIDFVDNCGMTFSYYSWSNLILSIGCERIEAFNGINYVQTRNISFNNISNEINYQLDDFVSISGFLNSSETDDNYFDYPISYKVLTTNDIHQQEFGSTIYYTLMHDTFDYEPFTFCYSPNFDEILGECQETIRYGSSCMNPTIEFNEDFYIIDILSTPQFQNTLRIINRNNCEVLIEQDCSITCNKILRASDNRIYFLDINTSEIVFYSIVDEIVHCYQNDIIDSYVNSISNFPNPFNPSTTFEFSIPKASKVDLSIFNIKGQKIRTLISEHITRGDHSVLWDGKNDNGAPVSSGVYFYSLIIDGIKMAENKCLLLK